MPAGSGGTQRAAFPPAVRWALLALAILAALAAAKWASSVVMPTVLGLFLVCLTWPVHHAVARRLGHVAGACCGLLAALAGIAALGGLIWLSVQEIAEHEQALRDGVQRLQQRLGNLASWADGGGQQGETAASGGNGGASTGTGSGVLASAAGHLWAGLGGLVLALAIQLLALVESPRAAALLGRWDATDGGQRSATAEATASAVRRYFVVRTLVGLATGFAVWIACLGLGIELALVYGVLNFALNYFPTIGSLVAVLPPALLTWATTGDPGQVALVIGVVGGIQLLMGTVVDPLVQGNQLECSATLVLVAVIAGGWLGGVPGAFLAMPVLLALRAWADRGGERPWLSEVIGLPGEPTSAPPRVQHRRRSSRAQPTH